MNVPNRLAAVTDHGIQSYLPRPPAERKGIGLSLSGGGYRAALFHLGSLRRLNEVGLLAKLRTISSVSGGSIISAHLATRIRWPLRGPLPDWEEKVAVPFRAFTNRNIRTGAMLKSLLPGKTAVRLLADTYHRHLTSLQLVELPDTPNFIFCATDLGYGVNWTFQKSGIGDYQAGYLTPAPPGFPVSLAVAASSCFPPVFKPLKLGLRPNQLTGGRAADRPEREAVIDKLRLSDGGVYDNLGLEPIWKDHEVVLASDGGAIFDFEADKSFIWEVKRYVSIPENQALALRKRWLVSNFLTGVMKGGYWGIGSATEHYGSDSPAGYSKELAEEVIAKIRTDLDSFSGAEAAVLENHGYLLAAAAIKAHLSGVISDPGAPLRIPHPDWMVETKVRTALIDSWKRKPLGRW